MDKVLLQEFFSQLNKLEGKEHLLSTIAYGTAPTLKGMKPSSLMSFSTRGRNLYRLWERYKDDVCASLGLRFFELKQTQERRLILFYNVEMLEKMITGTKSRAFLKEMGYDDGMSLDRCLQLLKMRFKHMCPHEIGVFLGIPVEDVLGFIRNKGEKCLFCSYWKVYHDPECAKNLFQCYDKAKVSVIDSIINGSIKEINEFKDSATISISSIAASLMQADSCEDELRAGCDQYMEGLCGLSDAIGVIGNLLHGLEAGRCDATGEVKI